MFTELKNFIEVYPTNFVSKRAKVNPIIPVWIVYNYPDSTFGSLEKYLLKVVATVLEFWTP